MMASAQMVWRCCHETQDTVPHGTLHLQHSAITGANEVKSAAVRNTNKYSSLCQKQDFFPAALETLGPTSASDQEFLMQIGRCLTEVTTDPWETAFLLQYFTHHPPIQCCLSSRHVPNFHVCTVTFPDTFLFLIFQPSGIEYRGHKK